MVNFLADTSKEIVSIDQLIVKWFNSIPYVGNLLLILFSLLIALFCGGLIGYEREFHGHSAGLRTHILVTLGSALVMALSIYGFGGVKVDGTLNSNRDPARLAAQVVSGIGFLGAGTIIKTGTDIKGLTTATTIWFAMALGLAAGAGRWSFAIIATMIALITLISMRKIEALANKRRPRIILVIEQDKPVLRHLLLLGAEYHVDVKDIQSTVITYKGTPALRIIVSFSEISRPVAEAYAEDIRNSISPFEIKVLGSDGKNKN
ncbi:MAG: MgtC/SapB family protein [Bacilli bacterium]|nr:MgtC/SapB family protein [Bacilli bacterium]